MSKLIIHTYHVTMFHVMISELEMHNDDTLQRDRMI